jgi:anti-anti-sigma factor
MGSAPTFDVRVETRNGVARLALAGELDMGTVPILKQHLNRVNGDGVHGLILDLRSLTFADSSALHTFLRAWDHARHNGHRMAIVGTSGEVRRLFEISGTEFLLDDAVAIGLLDRFTVGRARRADRAALEEDDARG